MKLLRIFIIVIAFSASLPEARAAIADTLDAMKEKSMGNEDAAVTVIEFASLTCPHCAEFHTEILPAIKKEFIDTGKVRFVYYDFPLDHYALRASMLARCNSHRDYFAFLDVLYQEQHRWMQSPDPLKALFRLARLAGLTGEDVKQCIGNKGLEDALLKQRLKAAQQYSLRATPSLVIDGELYDGTMVLDAVIDAIADSVDDGE